MDWQKHKQLYQPLNMGKLLYIALETWSDNKHLQAEISTKTRKRRPHLKLIHGKKDNDLTTTKK